MAAEKPGFDTIFCAAIEIPDAGERAAYIARACAGDGDLQRRVELLVAAHFRVGDFLEPPAARSAATVDDPRRAAPAGEAVRETPGMEVGPYKLLQQIGEGGMGTVYMAEQAQP